MYLHPNIDFRVLAEEEKGAGKGRHVEEGGEEEEKDEIEEDAFFPAQARCM